MHETDSEKDAVAAVHDDFYVRLLHLRRHRVGRGKLVRVMKTWPCDHIHFIGANNINRNLDCPWCGCPVTRPPEKMKLWEKFGKMIISNQPDSDAGVFLTPGHCKGLTEIAIERVKEIVDELVVEDKWNELHFNDFKNRLDEEIV